MTKCAASLLILAGVVGGCCTGTPPRDRSHALLRVNENLAKIDGPVQYKALVSFRFRDENGKMHRFLPHDASVIFEPPAALRFDVRSTLAGEVAQFGSNDEYYWLWTDTPDVRKLWYGRWDQIADGSVKRLAIPPNDLLDALMLRPLPERLGDGPLLTLRKETDDCRLVYLRVEPGGHTVGMREVLLDPCEPHQPTEIIDRTPDGEVVMHARLRDYRRAGRDGPFTPRRYQVEWPRSEAALNLDVLLVRDRSDLEPEVFEFPAGWQGEIETLDEPEADLSNWSTKIPTTP